MAEVVLRADRDDRLSVRLAGRSSAGLVEVAVAAGDAAVRLSASVEQLEVFAAELSAVAAEAADAARGDRRVGVWRRRSARRG